MGDFSQIRNEWFKKQVDRLREKGVTQKEIAQQLDVLPQYLTPILGGKRNVSENLILKFCEAFNINQNDLISRMRVYEGTSIEPPVVQEPIINFGKKEISEEICLYDISASAGFGSFDEMLSKEKVVGKYVVPDFKGVDWMIYVKGSSMYPKYSSGDIIACRVLHESKFIQWGKVYVVATREQGILVKRLRKSEIEDCILATSDNPSYEPFDIPQNEILGIALVVGVIRME